MSDNPEWTMAQTGSSSTSRNTVAAYTHPELTKLLNSKTTLTGLKQKIIPRFERTATQSNQDGAEDILCHADYSLERLDDNRMAILTVPLIYILTARLENNNRHQRKDQGLLDYCSRYTEVMDVQQAGMILSRVSRMSWAILELAKLCDAVDHGLYVLRRLCSVSPPQCLTGNHAAYLEGCLLARSYTTAIPVIREVYADVKLGGCNYLDIITFYHHAGLVAAAIQDFALATELFSIVVSVPTTTASAIQVAAAKRAVLCELLSTGKRYRSPKSTTQVVQRAVEKANGAYIKLGKAFEEKDWDAVETIVENEKTVFAKDSNTGLVNQVVGAVLESKILKTKSLYTRLTIDQLVARVATSRPKSADEVVTKLQEMITAGRVQAIISDSSPPVITFSDDLPAAPRTAVKELSSLNNVGTLLQHYLDQSSREMSMYQKYLQKQAEFLNVSVSGRGEGLRGGDDHIPPFSGRGQGSSSGFEVFM